MDKKPSEERFVRGDVVQLKSGGPLMLVTGIEERMMAPGIVCTWAGTEEAHSATLRIATFVPATLRLMLRAWGAAAA
jgi:uncharacterized protein YodC (DUF2158 family)